MRLLVIEDEVRIAEILRSALSRSGFAVDAVGRCGDARAALEVNPYDAVILDLGLPDGDGLVLLKDMRARGNALPVLVLTARDAVEHRVAGLDAGADDYLIKPFAMSEVVARIKAAQPFAKAFYDWSGGLIWLALPARDDADQQVAPRGPA